VISSLAGSSAFAALIWWVVPIGGLLGGLGYVVWVSKFKSKFESETSRSVGQFQRFQDSFRQDLPAEEERPSEDSPSPNDGANSPEKL
jgi:hypothetical protein